ncbi:MAG: hypothetical protein ACJ70O_01870 [Nitrososphaera sp.]|jgi:hypothetical protein
MILLAMWSSVVLFVLTFAVLGLLLGFAAVYDTNQEGQIDNAVIHENVSSNVTQGSPSISTNVTEESVQ